MASAIRVKGLAFMGLTDSGKWISIDTAVEPGGITGGPTPMELVLQALISCTGMDVVSILEKMKAPLTSFEVREEHERSPEHPKVYTSIHLTYIMHGEGIDPEKVKKAVSLSMDRYCSVSAMLRSSVRIEHHIEINGKRIE